MSRSHNSTPLRDALWANHIQRQCLLEAGGDIEVALAAAEYIVATQPIPDNFSLAQDAQGHEHKGKGPGGGQFTSKGKGGDSAGIKSAKLDQAGIEANAGGKVDQLSEDEFGLKVGITDRQSSLVEHWQDKILLPGDTPTDNKYKVGEVMVALGPNKQPDFAYQSYFIRSVIGDTEGVKGLIHYVVPVLETRVDNRDYVLVHKFVDKDIVSAEQIRKRSVEFTEPPDWRSGVSEPEDYYMSAALAHEVHNKRAQAVLDRTIEAGKEMIKSAKRSLASALKKDGEEQGTAILRFVDKYRTHLARLLTITHIATALEGMREVAVGIPTLATFPGAVTIPPSLEPRQAAALVERLLAMPARERAQAIYELSVDEQVYVGQAIAAHEAGPALATEDPHGNLHKGKGPGGGQFTSKGKSGDQSAGIKSSNRSIETETKIVVDNAGGIGTPDPTRDEYGLLVGITGKIAEKIAYYRLHNDDDVDGKMVKDRFKPGEVLYFLNGNMEPVLEEPAYYIKTTDYKSRGDDTHYMIKDESLLATNGKDIFLDHPHRVMAQGVVSTSQIRERIKEAAEPPDYRPGESMPEDYYMSAALAFELVKPEDGEPEAAHFNIIEAAVKELSEKNVLTREKFDRLNAVARAKAFTVAGIDAEDTLVKIRDVLAQNIAGGADYESFRTAVLDAVGEGTFMSEAHLETVFRTNVQSAFSDGQAAILAHPLVKSGFPYAAYNAIHDDRVRDNHLALESHGIQGTNIYRTDDPVFQLFRPPWDYNDRCGWTPMTIRQAAEAGIREAQQWLDSGVEPYPPAYVSMPPFQPPEGFLRAPLSIRLSMQSGTMFAQWDESKVARRGKGKGGGQFVKKGTGGGDGEQRTGPGVKGDGDGIGRGGDADAREPAGAGQAVATAPGGPGDSDTGGGRQDTDQPISSQPAGDTTTAADTPTGPHGPRGTIQPDRAGPATRTRLTGSQARAALSRVNHQIDRYTNTYRKNGQEQVADWLEELRDHINEVGVGPALDALGPGSGTADMPRVQYHSTDQTLEDAKFIKSYLDNVGITLLQEGDEIDPDTPLIAAAPVPEDVQKKRPDPAKRPGDVLPQWGNIDTKLQESKLLPGLESTEDLDVIMGGEKVTHFTKDVVRALDQRYGKGKWLVKSYGDEAYAGFGVFFPERIKKIRNNARIALRDTSRRLERRGYTLDHDEAGNVVGITNSNTRTSYLFGTEEYRSIPSKIVKRLGRNARNAQRNAYGAALPLSSEDSLLQNYNIAMRWGKVVNEQTGEREAVGITDQYNRNIDFNTPHWERFKENDYTGGALVDKIERAAAWGGVKGEVAFMAQPAFEAVGVTEAERALGLTWETSTEGRVHVVVKDGKASVVPYATLARREDTMPVVFSSDDIRAMEKAAQDTIDMLPESERKGQVYAPDVMKTAEGWRVVELNASVESGSSLWLEANPLVIDAYVSHVTGGRDPSHVSFMRNLLRDSLKNLRGRRPSPADSTQPDRQGWTARPTVPLEGKPSTLAKRGMTMATEDEQGNLHKGKGPGGGQFTSKGDSDETPEPREHVSLYNKILIFLGLRKRPKTPHASALDTAEAKLRNAPTPSEDDVQKAEEGIAQHGLKNYRKNLRSNTEDRRARRASLMAEFGDGDSCPCVYCGIVVGEGSLEQDLIVPVQQGGRFKLANLVPSCADCSYKRRRDGLSFEESIKRARKYARGNT